MAVDRIFVRLASKMNNSSPFKLLFKTISAWPKSETKWSTTFVSDFGQAEIVLNNNLKGDELFIFDANRTKIKPLKDRGFFHEYLGRKGDRFEGQIVGEYTLEFLQEKAHARIKGLA